MASTAPDPGERAAIGPPAIAATTLEPAKAMMTKEKKREPNILIESRDERL
jgi:hypothetical protein